MSFFIHPPVSAGGRQPGDELDNLLRAYFQSEMPDPWPALEIGMGSADAEVPIRLSLLPAADEPSEESEPEPVVRASFPGGSLSRSRLALAASVALLVSGSLFLSGQLPNVATTPEVRIPRDSGEARKNPDGLLAPPKVREVQSLIQKDDGTAVEIQLFEVPPGK
jgi:hypothetical protein